MSTYLKHAFLAASFLALSGCFIPEKFDAKITFNEDTTFNYTYDGTIINAMAAAEKQKTGSLPEKSKAAYSELADALKKDPATKSVSQVNDITYKVSMEKKNQPSMRASIMDFIKVKKDPAGVITVFTPKFSEKDLKQLKDLGVNVDGNLTITLPKNAELIESNANSKPFFGAQNSYSWKIKKVEEPVSLKFKFK